MGKRRKLRNHVRAQYRQRHPSVGGWVSGPFGVILCTKKDCDGSCDLWHAL